MSDAAARAAYHESGHAIVAVALGLTVGGAGIRPDHSYCYIGPAPLTDSLMVAFGGVTAEIIRFGTANADQARGDLQLIERYARRYHIPGHHIEGLRPRVRALLKQHWHRVERVAASLALARTLSSAEIDAAAGLPGRRRQ
jgi:hypothetical protein